MSNNREFFYRRLHSLLGVVPLGGFILVHFMVNYFATRGEEEFNRAAGFMESLPFLYALEIGLIFLPLIFHAVYGLYIAFQAKNNTSSFSYFRNWMFRLQRISGVIVLIFVTWHVWETRIAKMFGAEVNFNMMAEIVENPLALILYIIGITATTFHFANGLWSFFISWGITVSPRSQQISSYVSMGVFVVLTFIGVRAILAFAGIGV
ncbi:succinate dehydrogenase cytochrome b558 subunit [Paenalkalicoccus suaedae]|uniref:Succinate dehydrogenase cytochrome b558 subunit n=1 Tax=Paenalkalicoccus suaedae TaxID=2592382 RepID=A0A859FFS0_9BACI|nr:succinate dehydrogenase cytochrome b558 subunit [Paenalkalicoccus suaedae]QKS71979.1 succinate dehydrogenase cytochrome b558 subunit [Paenalkalicoccus suaedae]